MAEQSTAPAVAVTRIRQTRANAVKTHMSRKSLRRGLIVSNAKQLARTLGEKPPEAITDWVAVVKEELRTGAGIPILALAFAELVRQREQAENSGMSDLAQIVKKHLVGCAAAVLKAEDGAHSGLNGQSRKAMARRRAQASNKKNRREQNNGKG